MALKKPCSKAGCSNKIPVGKERYCPDCKPKQEALRKKQQKEYDKTQRNQNVISWLRSSRYQKKRLAFLKRNPLCVECGKKGYITQAKLIDHIIPHEGNYDLFWNIENWQSICNPCHEKKHSKDRWGRKQR